MKNLFQFLTEATAAGAKAQAAKLNLKSDGHGGWLDTRGNFVAKTEGGKLVFMKKRGPKADEGPVRQMAQRRADDKLFGSPLPKKEEPKKVKPADDTPKSEPDSGDNTLTLAFGRFNPPTIGHEKLLGAAKKAAAGGPLKIYPSRTQDPKKNPLDPDMKIAYMKRLFPEYEENIVNDAEMATIFDVLTTANEDGYTNVNIIVGADRQAEFENLAQKYNGDVYEFDQIRVISAGVRDSDAEGVEGMSASKLRKAVQDDDVIAFKRGIPKTVDDADAQALFDAVRTGMKQKKKAQKESYELWEIAPKYDQKGLRENYVKEKIFKIGDVVESLNTGLVGKIIRRGTNHLICLTQEENMFKSWIRDVMEAVKPAAKTGIYGVPATQREVGTAAHRKYAQSMVPGQEKIKNFDIKEFLNKYRKNK